LPGALAAGHAIAQLKQRLAKKGVAAIYANDNYGTLHKLAAEFSIAPLEERMPA